MTTAHVLVIGAGVSGLTSALCLARQGYRVTIVADRMSPEITSNVAGALWEWPPAVCGRHHDEALLSPSRTWSATSYHRFRELARTPAQTGVYLRPANFYFPAPVENDLVELTKMVELAELVVGFAHDPGLISRNGVNPRAGMVDAYTFLAPMIDTDRYLDWLHRQAVAAGCTVVRGRVRGDLRERERALRREFAVQVIVNCSGLGAVELAGDPDLSPHRGAVIRLDNTGASMPRVTAAHCVAHDVATDGQNMIFIVPRGEDRLLLGGLVQPDEWALDIDLDNYAPIRAMLARNAAFLPVLATATLDAAEPVRVGLRPFRGRSVRVEREPGTAIVHNYGHGGAGFSLSWGCAEDVAYLTRQLDEADTAHGVAAAQPPHGGPALVVGARAHADAW